MKIAGQALGFHLFCAKLNWRLIIGPDLIAIGIPGDIVLDPFAGSGTTGAAALACGRRFVLIDKVEQHCQTARARLAASGPRPSSKT